MIDTPIKRRNSAEGDNHHRRGFSVALPVFAANQRPADLREINSFLRWGRQDAGAGNFSGVEVEGGCARPGQSGCTQEGWRRQAAGENGAVGHGKTPNLSKKDQGEEFGVPSKGWAKWQLCGKHSTRT